jgi:hypothetical protein
MDRGESFCAELIAHSVFDFYEGRYVVSLVLFLTT